MLVFPTVLGPRDAGSGRRALRNWIGTISCPSNFTGVVEEIDTIREKMTVRVKMFLGREMQVELDLDQVDKVSADK